MFCIPKLISMKHIHLLYTLNEFTLCITDFLHILPHETRGLKLVQDLKKEKKKKKKLSDTNITKTKRPLLPQNVDLQSKEINQ